ncbi:MAG TPA: glycosyltransferase family 2 protein [Blastocatellia bacterium]|jgi:glycosyltransferase involved in cell wall biosynthesis
MIERAGDCLLSIVIETANTPPGDYRELDECLKAFAAQTIPREKFELIIVADPRLHPNLEEHLAIVAPHVRLLEAEGLHYYAQKNFGARAARAGVIAFMDSDCIPAATWAETILDVFARGDEHIGAVQGTVWSERTPLGFAFVITNFGLLQARFERRTTMLTGNNCAFRRDDILSAPFEEASTFHGSEVQMAAEIHRHGRHILLAPGAGNHHHFLPGFKLFLAHGLYWGYCFLKVRRGGANVPYGKLFRRIGPLAPLALVPAKAALDIWRMGARKGDLGMSATETIGCAAALLVNSIAVGAGAARAFLRMPPPTTPTSSNAHMSAIGG